MKTKKQLNLYPFYDLQGMADHFEKMALQGWQVKKTNGLVVTYEAGPKEKKHYGIATGGEVSAYTPDGKNQAPSFRKQAESQGWTQVYGDEKRKIFASDLENPGPLHASPYDKIQGISQMAGPVLFLYGTMIGLGVLSLLLFFFKLKNTPVNLLSSSTGFLTPALLLLLGAYNLADMILYLRFKNQSDVEATKGKFAEVKVHMHVPFSYLLILSAGVLCFGTVTSGGSALGKTFVLCLGVTLALILLIGYLKNLTLSAAGEKKGLLTVFNVLLAVVLVGGVIFSMNAMSRADAGFSGDLLFTAQDLDIQEDPEQLGQYVKSKASFLLRHTEASQVRILEEGNYEPILSYELVDSRAMGVDGFVVNHYLNRMKNAAMMDEKGEVVHPNHYEPADPGLWQAEKAWQVVTEGEKGNVYLLLYGDRLAEVGFMKALSEKQIASIGEKLKK